MIDFYVLILRDKKMLRQLLSFSKSIHTNTQRISSQKELTEKLRQKKQAIVNSTLQRPSIGHSKQKASKSINKKQNPKLLQHKSRLSSLESSHLLDEEQRIKLVHDDKPEDSIDSPGEEIYKQEKEFLSQVSFKIRNSQLDKEGHELLEKMPSLTKTSVDPRHLSILHSSLANKIANLIYPSFSTQNSIQTFIELQPGFGMVTKSLLNLCTQQNDSLKFILIEEFSKFLPYLQELKSAYPNHDLKILKSTPFKENFLFESNPNNKNKILDSLNFQNPPFKDLNISIFGIVPWNNRQFLTNLFSTFCSDSGFFGLDKLSNDLNIKTPEFFLYIPEFYLAKLNPYLNPNFTSFNSKLSVFSYTFSKIKVLSEEKCDFFFLTHLFLNKTKIL